jgi:hypothetical protein
MASPKKKEKAGCVKNGAGVLHTGVETLTQRERFR